MTVGDIVGVNRMPCLYVIQERGAVDCSIRVAGAWYGGFYDFYFRTLSPAYFFGKDTWW